MSERTYGERQKGDGEHDRGADARSMMGRAYYVDPSVRQDSAPA